VARFWHVSNICIEKLRAMAYHQVSPTPSLDPGFLEYDLGVRGRVVLKLTLKPCDVILFK
jgi:hypothetical protein